MKKLNSILKIISAVMLVMVISSCEKSYYQPIEAPVDVSYATDMQPFFNTNCNTTGCHDGGFIPLNLLENVSYDALINGGYIDVDKPEESKLYVKITAGESMEQYANATQRTMVLSWIEQGAKNN